MTEQELLHTRVEAVRRRLAAACHTAGRAENEVLLCAASKTQTPATVALAAPLAIDLFGENRVQELVEKHAVNAYAPKPLHFIGHLQTNKIKQVVGAASLIHSVGSAHLMEAINKEALRQGLCQPILLEVNLGEEESKSGISPAELPALAEAAGALPGVQVQGLMCIPPRAETETEQRRWFCQMRALFDSLAARRYAHLQLNTLSMGMSGDFEAAILEGATLVRVGTAIFGSRNL